MAGIKGMVPARPRKSAVRNQIWQSMRILRRFTTPDLCRTTGAQVSNVAKFVRRLRAHGYVARFGTFTGGLPGIHQAYRLVKDCGPAYPLRCETCGRPLGQPCEVKEETDG